MAGLAKYAVAVATLATTTSAEVFLGAYPQVQDHELRKDDVEQALLSEISVLASSFQIRNIEEELRPLHAAAPKNEQGKLEPSVVRYLLHRHFAQKYGWHVKGLERVGGAWNSSSPANIMKDAAPAYIESLFAERLHGHGLGLQDLAVFAATLSDLIRKQVIGEMEYIYELQGLTTSQPVATEHIYESVLKWYLVGYMHGVDLGADKRKFIEYESYLVDHLFSWPDATMWVQDLQHAFDFEQQSLLNPFKVDSISFERSVDFAEELAHRLGSFHNLECSALKDQLVDMEYAGTGRVRLSEFYSGRHDPDWPFLESVEYLRAMGALDESDPRHLSVVIPNYIGSKANCMHGSDFYSVCCVDECEGLLGHIERAIAEPAARPERIAEVVASLGTDTMYAPRNMSSTQLARLHEIAEQHGGQVPLHGRLFAQWMHHAYPRECPFPHVTGTTNPMSPEDWLFDMGSEHTYSNEEMEKYVFLQHEHEHVHDGKTLRLSIPWTAVEELVASHKQVLGGEDQHSAGSWTRLAVLLAMIMSAALPGARASSKLIQGGPSEAKMDRHLV